MTEFWQHQRIWTTWIPILTSNDSIVARRNRASCSGYLPAIVARNREIEERWAKDAILTYSPSTRMRLHQTAIGFQATQARPQTVPYFKLQNVAGGFMTSDDLKGKVTVIDLWATWCHWCAEEVPIYNQLYDSFQGRDDVVVVGITIDSPRRDVPSRVRKLGMRYPVLIDDGAGQDFGPVRGLPTTIILNKDGTIYKHYEGALPQKGEKLKQDIQQLLAEDSPLA